MAGFEVSTEGRVVLNEDLEPGHYKSLSHHSGARLCPELGACLKCNLVRIELVISLSNERDGIDPLGFARQPLFLGLIDPLVHVLDHETFERLCWQARLL
jgi:hypothetical protein